MLTEVLLITSYPYRNGVMSPPKSSLAVCASVLQLANLNFTYSELYNDLDTTCCYNDSILNTNKQWMTNSQPTLKTNQDRKLVFVSHTEAPFLCVLALPSIVSKCPSVLISKDKHHCLLGMQSAEQVWFSMLLCGWLGLSITSRLDIFTIFYALHFSPLPTSAYSSHWHLSCGEDEWHPDLIFV